MTETNSQQQGGASRTTADQAGAEWTSTDRMSADQARALAGVVGGDVDLRPGDDVPLLWHQVFFLPRPTQDELGVDGHPKVGFPTPPEPGMRRMFAGGRVRLSRGLRIGDEAIARTEVISSVDKHGQSGPLTLMTTRTTVTDVETQQTALIDERDIVYLPPNPVDREPAQAVRVAAEQVVPEGDLVRTVEVDPTLLFRFSALTYNAHRIHYDRDYARDVEGHADLVVHGPLQAVLMAGLVTQLQPQGREFSYRLISPLYLGQGLHLAASRTAESSPGHATDHSVVTAQITDDSGRVTARATWSS